MNNIHIRTTAELNRLNSTWAMKENGRYRAVVSVYGFEELRSGLPQATDPRPFRVSRFVFGSENAALTYAQRLASRYNRRYGCE